MAESTLWWLLAGGAIVLELVTGTFYLLMVATGFIAAALAAHLGLGGAMQLLLAAIVGLGAVIIWHRFGPKRSSQPAQANRDVNMDIGASVLVENWQADGTTTVRYRGAQWSAIAARNGMALQSGAHRIVEIIGSRLVIEKI